MKKIFFIFWIITGFFLINAEQLVLDLEKAIQIAIENDISYKISQKQVDLYKQRLKNIGLLPQITLEGIKNLDEKLQVIEMPSFVPGGQPMKIQLDFTKNYEFTFQVLQPIFSGGKIYFSFRNSLLDLKGAREQEKNSREETILKVKKAFYNILVMEKYQKAQQEALNLAEKNLENVRKSYELGLVSQYDLLRSELAASSIQPEVSRAKNLYEISLLNLKNILQLPEDVELVIQGELKIPEFREDLSRLLQLGVENRFEIKQLKLEREKLANLLKMAYGQYLPQVALVARYNYRSNLFNFKKDNWEDYYSINLAISFPIFPGLSRNAQIGELKVSQKILALNEEALISGTRLEIENRFMTIKQESENIISAQKNLQLAEEGVRIAQLNYQEGMISILELNSSLNELTRAKVALLQALFNYNINIAELEKLIGKRYQGGVK